jgi:hypothetical protein
MNYLVEALKELGWFEGLKKYAKAVQCGGLCYFTYIFYVTGYKIFAENFSWDAVTHALLFFFVLLPACFFSIKGWFEK